MINVTKTDLPQLEEYVNYLNEIWESNWITNNGNFVQSLESELEKFLKTQNLLVVSNGTQALQIALKSLNIKDEIITTPFTFVATTNAIIWENLTPVFADIDPETFNIDPDDVKRKITNKTTAILAVHVYGNPCYLDELQAIADENRLKLIYDAAHAFDVEYNNDSVLNYGDISTLSFHATKIFNSGEGGAIVVKDDELLEMVSLMRNHGIKSEEEITFLGTNAKMSELHAALGLCNLKHVKTNISLREKIYKRYKNGLSEVEGINFQKIIASQYNYSYMPVCFENMEKRDEIYSKMLKIGIKSRKYFHPLLSNFEYINSIAKSHNLTVAPNVADRVLCLPLYSDLEMEYLTSIIDLIEKSTK